MQYSEEYYDIIPTQSAAMHPRLPLPSGVPRPAKFIRLDAALQKDYEKISVTVRSWKCAHQLLVSRQNYFGQLYRVSRDPFNREQYWKMCRLRVESRQAWDAYHMRLLDVQLAQQRHVELRDQLQKWSVEQNRAANMVYYEARTRNTRRLSDAELKRYRNRHMPKLLARMTALNRANDENMTEAPAGDNEPAVEEVVADDGERSAENNTSEENARTQSNNDVMIAASPPLSSSPSSKSSDDVSSPTKSDRQLCMDIVNDK